jgi:hypothetical protein
MHIDILKNCMLVKVYSGANNVSFFYIYSGANNFSGC